MRAVPFAVLLLLAPAVAADTVVGTFEDVGTLRLDIDSRIPDEDAAQLRAEADADDDGTVTQAEADAMEAAYMDLVEAIMEGDLKEDITLDGKEPTGATIDAIAFDGLAGPVASASAIHAKMGATIRFTVQPAERHTLVLVGGNEADEAGTEPVVLKAPPGYVVASHRGIQGTASLSADKTTLTFTDPADPEAMTTIVFAKSRTLGTRSSPDVAFPLLAAALLGLAFGRRP